MDDVKTFMLPLSEAEYNKLELLQTLLPGQMYKSDMIRMAIDILYYSTVLSDDDVKRTVLNAVIEKYTQNQSSTVNEEGESCDNESDA